MPVNSKTVSGRRDLTFQSLDDIVADAECLVASPKTKTLGNWPLTQLLTHLSSTVENSIDGFQVKAPLFVRLIVPFLKGRVLCNKMSPGIKLPKSTEAHAFPARQPLDCGGLT